MFDPNGNLSGRFLEFPDLSGLESHSYAYAIHLSETVLETNFKFEYLASLEQWPSSQWLRVKLYNRLG